MEIKTLEKKIHNSVDDFNLEMKGVIDSGFRNLLFLIKSNGESFSLINPVASSSIDGAVIPRFVNQEIIMSRSGSNTYDFIECRISTEKEYQSAQSNSELIKELVREGEDLLSRLISIRVTKKAPIGIYPGIYADYYCIVVGMKSRAEVNLSKLEFCAKIL